MGLGEKSFRACQHVYRRDLPFYTYGAVLAYLENLYIEGKVPKSTIDAIIGCYRLKIDS